MPIRATRNDGLNSKNYQKKKTTMAEIKAEIRIPTTQYGFISLNVEVENAEEAIAIHNSAVSAYNNPQKVAGGVVKKVFDNFLDRYLTGQTMTSDDRENYLIMSPEQQTIVQAIKRSLNRIEAKQGK